MLQYVQIWRQYRRAISPIRAKPRDLSAWIELIDRCSEIGWLNPHTRALVKAHEINPQGHAVNSFAPQIVEKCGAKLEMYARSPGRHVSEVVDEIVRWKTILQCGHTHDVSKGYFIDAESAIAKQWNGIIYPIIKDLNFSSILDLACGHGRNSEYLRRLTKQLHLVDINQSCIEACHERFGDEMEGTRIFYHVTDGNHLGMIPNASISLVYTWDSMVHFDKLVVKDYVNEIGRVLMPGGSAFLHHSNYGSVAPDSDWAHNAGTRSDMSAVLMRDYAKEAGLEVTRQDIQGIKEGWGMDGLDCVTLLRRA
jgi:SAM-dependent methyltransferase